MIFKIVLDFLVVLGYILDMDYRSNSSWTIKTRYFKLVGKKTYFFKLHIMNIKGVDTDNGVAVLYNFNSKAQYIDNQTGVEDFINKTMVNHGLKYVLLTEDEIKLLELMYEV